MEFLEGRGATGRVDTPCRLANPQLGDSWSTSSISPPDTDRHETPYPQLPPSSSRSIPNYPTEHITAKRPCTMSTIKDITSLEQWEQHLSSLPPSTLLIVSFHAAWAAPCAQMATVLSTLASEYPVTEPLSTSWVSVDAEELSDISEAYNVTAVPFLVLVRGGQVLETVSGSSAIKVRNAIESHAKQSGKEGTAAETTGANGTSASVETSNAADSTPEDPEKKKEELFKRLGDLVKAAPVMLFMKGTPSEPKCGFSRQLVALLRENAVKYGFFNILADDDVRQGLKEFADWPTYPQLWMDGELVGGLDIVCSLPNPDGHTVLTCHQQVKEELSNDADFFKSYSVKSAVDGAAAL